MVQLDECHMVPVVCQVLTAGLSEAVVAQCCAPWDGSSTWSQAGLAHLLVSKVKVRQ